MFNIFGFIFQAFQTVPYFFHQPHRSPPPFPRTTEAEDQSTLMNIDHSPFEQRSTGQPSSSPPSLTLPSACNLSRWHWMIWGPGKKEMRGSLNTLPASTGKERGPAANSLTVLSFRLMRWRRVRSISSRGHGLGPSREAVDNRRPREWLPVLLPFVRIRRVENSGAL